MVSMVNLKRLVLADNPLTDLCPMGSFKSLTYLDISNDRIQNIPADLLQTSLLHFKLGTFPDCY
jgi:Leucine-rich repeat (LRR) protein